MSLMFIVRKNGLGALFQAHPYEVAATSTMYSEMPGFVAFSH